MLNLYSYPLLIAAIFNLFLAVFMLAISKRKLIHILFSIWCACMAVWNFGVYMLCVVPTQELAWMWTKLFQNGMVFIYSTFFHLVVLLTSYKITRINRILIFIAYVSSFIFLISNNIGTLFVQEIVHYPWGYYPVSGIIGYVYTLIFGTFVFYSIFLLVRAYMGSKGLWHTQIGQVLLGTFIGYGSGATNFFPVFGVPIYPLGNIFNIIYSLIIAYAILKDHFLILTPTPEDTLLTENHLHLEAGYSYLVKESSPKKGFEVFDAFVRRGIPGLCVTTSPTPEIREKYKLVKTPVIRLIPEGEKEENHVTPAKLPLLLDSLRDFLGKAKESVILLDGLNFIIQYNRENALDFVADLNEAVSKNNSRLLILISPEEADTQSEDLIEKDLNPIRHIRPLKSLLFELFRGNIKGAGKYGFSEADFLIREGSSCLVKENDPGRSFLLYRQLLDGGLPGLCISKEPLSAIKELRGITRGVIYCLNKLDAPDCIDPGNPGRLLETIDNFIKQNKSAVVLLDGFEFLTSYNGFNKMLETVEKIKNTAVLRGARLILPVGAYLLDDKEMALLSKNAELL